MRGVSFIVAVLVLVAAGKASANIEINGLFDARSTALGGTGAGYLDSAGVIPINPAALDQIDRMAFTFQGLLIITQPEAPYTITHPDSGGGTYQNYETIRFDPVTAPLGFLGGAYRVHERVVVGAGVYPLLGMGTTAAYRPAPELRPQLEIKNEVAAGLGELGVPVSVRLLDNLSVALMWRATYVLQKATQPVAGGGVGGVIVDPSGNPIYADLDVSGWDFTGLQAGVFYKPIPSLRIGLSYRSKVKVDATGTTKSKNPVDGSSVALDTTQSFSSPHTFRAGVAWTTLHDKLMFAADFKYLMYAEAYKSIDTIVVMNGMSIHNPTITNWKDAYTVNLGSEYEVSDGWWLRAGYLYVTSATPKDYAKAAMAPPGASNAVTAGLGIKIVEQLNVDLAGAVTFYETEVDTATPDNAGVGTYGSNTTQLAVSATYHN